MKELQLKKKRKSEDEEEEVLRLKRTWRQAEKGVPDVTFIIEQLSLKRPEGKIPTPAFLCVSNLLLHIIG